MGDRNDRMNFISEPIEPVVASMNTSRLAVGEPAVPVLFKWRGREYTVVEVLETRRQTSRCHSGSDEQYVRRHWFKVRTADGSIMQIYFDRQPASSREAKKRWWLYSISK